MSCSLVKNFAVPVPVPVDSPPGVVVVFCVDVSTDDVEDDNEGGVEVEEEGEG